MEREVEILRVMRDLAKNSRAIKESVDSNDLPESQRLVGERVSLIEDLRRCEEAKVPVTSSDIKDEMNLLMKNMRDDVLEASRTIMAKNAALLKELANVGNAKRIAAYAALRNPAYSLSAINERDKISRRDSFGIRRTSWP